MRRRRKFRSGGGESKGGDKNSGLTCLPVEIMDQIIKTTGLNFTKTNKELMEIGKNWHQIKTLDPETLQVKNIVFRKDSDEWKEFEKHGLKLDLSGKDLRGKDLRGADLRNANLFRADLRNANLFRADLSGADLRGVNLWKANLSGADLRGADLRGANLPEAYLVGAYLVGADLSSARLIDADLRGAYLIDANLRVANLEDAILTRANLTGAELPYANLRGANLTNAILIGANLTGAKLTNANLIGANFVEANLTGANLTGANLTGANLTNANFVEANLTGSLLSGANLSNADCTEANFENARTERFYKYDSQGVSHFTPLKAYNTKFMGANFQRFGRNRQGSYVSPEFNSADFRGADLRGASFNYAMFRPAKTGEPGAIFDHHTKFKGSNEDHNVWFIGATFENVDFSGLDLSKLTMGGSHDCSTKFVNCNLNRTNFAHCNLYQALFSKCSMIEVNMKHIVGEDSEYFYCDLSLAKFNHAHLRNARFSKNNLSQADFRDSKHVEIILHDDNVLTGIKVNDGTTKAGFRKLIQRRVEYNLNARNLRMINQLSRLSDDIRNLPSNTLGSEIVPFISDKYRQDRRTKEWKPKGKKLRFRSRKRKKKLKKKSRKRKSN